MANPKATKLPSGKWRARAFDYMDENGKRHYVSFTADTAKEARLAARMHVPSGGRVNVPYPELTLKEAYKRYIDSRTDTLSPSTVREYRRASKRDFPSLMPMELKNITPELVQTAVNEAAALYAPKTVRDKHGLLHKVLRTYAPFITLKTDFPQRKKKKVIIPTTEQVIKSIESAPHDLRIAILLASQCPLRRSEIAALTPDDFTDFGVRVTKAMVKNENNNWVIKPPKTEAGYRFCQLPKDVLKEVRGWNLALNPDQIENRWQRLKRKLGYNFRFHAFRHYWASLMHFNGVPDHYIMKTGGWSSMQIVHEIYTHTMDDKEVEVNTHILDIMKSELGSATKKA